VVTSIPLSGSGRIEQREGCMTTRERLVAAREHAARTLVCSDSIDPPPVHADVQRMQQPALAAGRDRRYASG
jgi:hypothetical protein